MMKKRVTDAGKLHFSPLTPEHWGDLVRLFGQHGATGGC